MLTVDPSHVARPGLTDGRPADLAVVVPTFNEAENVPVLVEKLEAALFGHAWEVIFVDDDSPDQTAEIVRRIGRTKSYVRCLHRVDRQGLSSAVIEGVLSTNAPYVAVMDADLQHDETILLSMLRILENKEADIVVGSRYTAGGDIGEWARARQFVSRTATALSQMVLRSTVSDPMSGFFMLPREIFVASCRTLSKNGYKILFDLLTSAPTPLRVHEVPYSFRPRLHGESKLDLKVMGEHIALLLKRSVGRIIPVQTLMLFGLLSSVILAHLGLLSVFLSWTGFTAAQTIAAVIVLAVTSLFPILAKLRQRQVLKGSRLIGFFVRAGIGLAANLSLATVLFNHTHSWWLAGGAGAAFGALWRYSSWHPIAETA